MGFADCKETAIRVSGEIPESSICYGLYIPTSSPESWDSRWQREGDPVFTHFWVRKGNTIFDHAVDQFGETETTYYVKDKRYVQVGLYLPSDNYHKVLVDDPFINWGTLTEDGGTVIVRWKSYDEHMRTLRRKSYLKSVLSVGFRNP